MKIPNPPDLKEQRKDVKISDLHPDLRRQEAVKWYGERSGDFVDTPLKFKRIKAVNLGLLEIGYDRSAMLRVFNSFAWQTADNGRIKETNYVQLNMPPAINVIPNAGTLGEKEEDKVGTIAKIIGWITNRGEGAEKK